MATKSKFRQGNQYESKQSPLHQGVMILIELENRAERRAGPDLLQDTPPQFGFEYLIFDNF